MVVIQVQVGKTIVEDVLIDGGASVNIIIENFITKLGLPKPRPVPYHFILVDQKLTRPLQIIKIEDSYTWYTIYNHIYYFEK
jgi:hypothetical protein